MSSCYWCQLGGEVETHYHDKKWLDFHDRCWAQIKGEAYVPIKKDKVKRIVVRRVPKEEQPTTVPQCMCMAGKLYGGCPYFGGEPTLS